MFLLRQDKQQEKSKINTSVRFSKNVLKDLRAKAVCCICGEKRALEVAHIIPVYVSLLIEGFKKYGKDVRNAIILCRNHHWCFDHMELTDGELEKIYQSAKDFIDTEFLPIANSKIKPKVNLFIPDQASNRVRIFEVWKEWVSRVFFICPT